MKIGELKRRRRDLEDAGYLSGLAREEVEKSLEAERECEDFSAKVNLILEDNRAKVSEYLQLLKRRGVNVSGLQERLVFLMGSFLPLDLEEEDLAVFENWEKEQNISFCRDKYGFCVEVRRCWEFFRYLDNPLFSAVRSLEISDMKVERGATVYVGFSNLAKSDNLRELRFLGINDSSLSSNELRILVNADNLMNVEALSLARNLRAAHAVKILCQSRMAENLVHLDLEKVLRYNVDCELLANCRGLSGLKVLRISHEHNFNNLRSVPGILSSRGVQILQRGPYLQGCTILRVLRDGSGY